MNNSLEIVCCQETHQSRTWIRFCSLRYFEQYEGENEDLLKLDIQKSVHFQLEQ